MRESVVARKYAIALVGAVKLNEYDRISSELRSFLKAFNQTELGGILTSPLVPKNKKHDLIEIICEKYDFHRKTRNFLHLVVERNRARLLPLMIKTFQKIWWERHNVEFYDVITAVPVDEGFSSRLKEVLEKKRGSKVILNFKVDPSILGGVVLRKGFTVYDGSLRKQLELIKNKIAGEA